MSKKFFGATIASVNAGTTARKHGKGVWYVVDVTLEGVRTHKEAVRACAKVTKDDSPSTHGYSWRMGAEQGAKPGFFRFWGETPDAQAAAYKALTGKALERKQAPAKPVKTYQGEIKRIMAEIARLQDELMALTH